MIDLYIYTERTTNPLSLKLNPIWRFKNDDEQRLDNGTTDWDPAGPPAVVAPAVVGGTQLAPEFLGLRRRRPGPQLHGHRSPPHADGTARRSAAARARLPVV